MFLTIRICTTKGTTQKKIYIYNIVIIIIIIVIIIIIIVIIIIIIVIIIIIITSTQSRRRTDTSNSDSGNSIRRNSKFSSWVFRWLRRFDTATSKRPCRRQHEQ